MGDNRRGGAPMTANPTQVELVEGLVERVAKAIYDAAHKGAKSCYAWDDAWEPYQEARREDYYRDARAALAALSQSSEREAKMAAEIERMREALEKAATPAPAEPTPVGDIVSTDEIAKIIAPELWGNPFAYPDHIHSDETLAKAREHAIAKARAIARKALGGSDEA